MKPTNPYPQPNKAKTIAWLIAIMIVTVFMFFMSIIGTAYTCHYLFRKWHEWHKPTTGPHLEDTEPLIILSLPAKDAVWCDSLYSKGCIIGINDDIAPFDEYEGLYDHSQITKTTLKR